MKSSCIVAIPFVALLAASSPADAAVKVAKDCTQAQRQFVNKLLEQDVNPFKACASKAKGDITTLSTSRLCPIAECKAWLEYMADQSPDCVYDDTNYGVTFTAKAKDCGGGGSSSGEVAGEADASKSASSSGSKATQSSSGSSSEAGTTTTPVKDTVSSSSGSGSLAIETIEVPVDDGSTVVIPEETTPEPTTRTPAPAVTQSAASANQFTTRALGALCAVSVTIAALAL